MQEKELLEERARLIERNKELSCLYEIAKIVAHTETTVAEVLQAIVDVAPSAFQFPCKVYARIIVDDEAFMTAGFSKSGYAIRDTLQLEPPSHGIIEVFYHRRDEAEQELLISS